MLEKRQSAGPSLLVFSDDWGRHPSSCQHLIQEFLPTYQVTWVNTIGMRPPSLDWATVRRGFEKLRHWGRREEGEQELPSNLTVVNPLMWPWLRTKRDRKLNQRLLTRALGPKLRAMRQPVVGLTTIPVVADLIGTLPVDRWIYYCVDDFAVWPGLDAPVMQRMEQELLEKVDSVIAVSDVLCDKATAAGRDARLLTHGVDLDFWRCDGERTELVPHCLQGLEKPWIVFWGVIDRRMDVDLVRRLAEDLNEGTIALIGPLQNPDPKLFSHRRVAHLPPLPLEDLPSIGAAADVLIMPYADLPVTRAMQPLKLKEYLATGKPVVVRDLPSTRGWNDCLDMASSPVKFSRAVRRRLTEPVDSEQQRARERLEQESWRAKAARLEQLVAQADMDGSQVSSCDVLADSSAIEHATRSSTQTEA